MDQFKFNAAKMIAAQKTKSRPISPESESNWDSSDAENTAPHISSDDEPSIASTKGRTVTLSKDNNNSTPRSNTKPSTQHLKPNNVLSGNRTPVKNSPAASIKSGTSKKGNVTVFADHGFDSDEDFSVASKASKKSVRRAEKEKVPPYDFRNAIQGTPIPDGGDNAAQRPGKSRKGNSYDPTPKKPQPKEFNATDSWDDTDDEERETLTAIRKEMEKHSKGSKQDLTSSPETKDNTKSNSNEKQNYVVKPRGRLRNSKSQNNPSPKSEPNLTQQLTATTSDVELSKMVTTLDATGNYGDMSGDYEKDTENYGKHTQSSTMEGNFGTGMPTLPAINAAYDHRYVYRYDHGSTAYYDTRQGRQEIYMTKIADKSERLVRRCTLEIFAACRIVADFFIIIILELLRFIAYHVIGVFLVGLLTTFGDYLYKPVLAAFFNAIIQPMVVFLYNIGVGFRTIMSPVIDIMRGVFTQIALLLRAFRLVEVNRTGVDYSNIRSIQEV